MIVVRNSAVEKFARYDHMSGEMPSPISNELKHFAEFKTRTIRFTNRYRSYVQLNPLHKTVIAHFNDDAYFPLANFPTNYAFYDIYYGSARSHLLARDINAVASWTSAYRVTIYWNPRDGDKDIVRRLKEIKNVEIVAYDFWIFDTFSNMR